MQTTESGIPIAYPLERYSILWTRSPFLMEVVPESTGEVVSPFQDYALTGVMTTGNFKMASFYHKGESRNFVVSTEPKPADPFRLLSIEPGPDLASTIVSVVKDGEEGRIMYDPEASKQRRMAAGGGGGGGAPPPGVPPQPPQPQANNNGNNRPPPPSPRPGSNTAQRPTRNANVDSPNNTGQGSDNARKSRRRVIIPRQVPSR